jgi:hypothetical protein
MAGAAGRVVNVDADMLVYLSGRETGVSNEQLSELYI